MGEEGRARRSVSERGSGIDSVYASVSYTLGNSVENLTLTGTAVMGTGNTAANIITGNASDYVLDGRGGKDHLDGMDGSDVYVVRNPLTKGGAELAATGETRTEPQ